MIRAIALRELRSMFVSPLAWVVLAVVEFIVAFLFLSQVDEYMQIQNRLSNLPGAPGLTDVVVAPILGIAGFIALLVVPLLCMRSIAEERRNQTLTLLLSSPVSMTQIVLGKFTGLAGFLLIMLGLIALMPLSLLAGADLDLGQLAAGLLGLALLLAAFTAIGLFLSSLTAEPAVAAISTFGALLLLWVIDWAGKTGGEGASSLFAYLSVLRHYESLLKGVFASQDVAYYLIVIVTFLILTVWRLDMDRVQG